jgi:hypothetical protein
MAEYIEVQKNTAKEYFPNFCVYWKEPNNGSQLCAGGDLEHESFKLAQKPIRITAVEFSNSALLAQNRC